MSTHATVETLSAYLDHELPHPESREIEEHLADCADCRTRFAGMKNVVSGLRHLERLAPPSTLQQVVARRVAFDGERKSLGDRLESNLQAFERQSSLLALFGVVVAFAVMILFFAHGLEQRRSSTIPVVFKDPRAGAGSESRQIAGRELRREGAVWVEEGVDPKFTRIVVVDSPSWERIVSEHPEIATLASLDRPAVVKIGEEVLRIEKAVDGD